MSYMKLLRTVSYLLLLALYVCFSPGSVLAQTFTNEDLKDIVLKHPYYAGSASCTAQNTPGTSGSLDSFLKALALQESSGNPKADNKSPESTASGKYAYIDGTWHSVSQTYYPPALQYPRALDAPEAVQDATVYIEYSKKLKDFQGDFFKMAVSHFYPLANSDPSKLDTVIPPNTITPRQYADAFLSKVQKGEGKDIPLLYAQAPDFQKYLTEKGAPVDSVAGDQPSSTPAANTGCANQSGTGTFVFYSQYDGKWADHRYGTSTIAESGCGPSSLAMVIATLGDTSVTPVEVADYGTLQNYYTSGQGSSWELFTTGAAHWNISSEDLGTDMDKTIEFLRTGGLVIASGTGPVPFTDSGHIIVLRGITEDGKILVGDPAHPKANEASFDPTDLSTYIKNMWGMSK